MANLTVQTLEEIRSRAIKHVATTPDRVRIEGCTANLDPGQVQALSWLRGTLEVLAGMGIVPDAGVLQIKFKTEV